MSFSSTCKIHFHTPTGVYYSGDILSGTVQFTLNKPKTVNGVFIELKGYSKVSWTERHGTGDKAKTYHFQSRCDYFSTISPLIRSDGPDTVELPEGEHNFDFSFQLPHNCPSSFEGQNGKVRYTAKVIMNQPWKLNKQQKVAFTVLSIVDMNMDPLFTTPVAHRMEKSNFSLFSKSGVLEVEALMPGTGFVPGQSIPIRLIVKNESNASINQFSAHLTQTVMYIASGVLAGSDQYKWGPLSGVCTLKNKLLQVDIREEVEKNSTKEIDLAIEIPPTPPSTMAPNHNINISYYVKIIAQVSGMHRNLDGKFPVTIGTIPFYGHQEHQQLPLMLSESHCYNPYFIHPDQSLTEPNSAPSAPHLPPPSYQECMQSTEVKDGDDDDDDGTYENGYRPRYPVYTIPAK